MYLKLHVDDHHLNCFKLLMNFDYAFKKIFEINLLLYDIHAVIKSTCHICFTLGTAIKKKTSKYIY